MNSSLIAPFRIKLARFIGSRRAVCWNVCLPNCRDGGTACNLCFPCKLDAPEPARTPQDVRIGRKMVKQMKGLFKMYFSWAICCQNLAKDRLLKFVPPAHRYTAFVPRKCPFIFTFLYRVHVLHLIMFKKIISTCSSQKRNNKVLWIPCLLSYCSYPKYLKIKVQHLKLLGIYVFIHTVHSSALFSSWTWVTSALAALLCFFMSWAFPVLSFSHHTTWELLV